MIRCRHCGEKASSELALCPHCGRELLPAPPRLLTWGIPALLVVLFVAVLAGQLNGRAEGGNPMAWVQSSLSSTGIGDGAKRGIVVVMTPVPPAEDEVEAPPAAEEAIEPVVVAEGDVVAAAPIEVAQVEALPIADVPVADVQADGAEVQPAASPAEQSAEQPLEQTAPPTPMPPATASSENVPLPTAALVAATEAPPATPTASATSAPPTVKPAASPPPALVAAAGAAAKSAALELPSATPTQPPATGTWTPTAAPTATPAPTATATATPLPAPTYEIRRGDTLIVVARRYEVALEDLMRANNISPNEAFTIQPGQILVIPTGDDPTPTASPMAVATTVPTATPVPATRATNTPPPTATVQPVAAQSVIRLDAPVLRSPEPGTPVSCSAPTSLVWLPVPFMRAEDKYVMHLGFVNGLTDANQEIVIWVLEQPRPANITSWDMDASLCALAPQEYGRQWRWYVEVSEEIDGKFVPVSPPSETWSLSWN